MSVPLQVWSRLSTGLRRATARRPWLQWLAIAACSVAAAAAAHTRLTALDDARDAWGRSTTVWVAADDIDKGEPLATTPIEAPSALVPASAVDEQPAGRIARQRIGRGEIVTIADVMSVGDLAALTPDGWLVTPVEERPSSGASLGEHVRVVTDGFVLVERAVVVGFNGPVVLLAAPAEVAPLVPAASETGAVTLLRVP